MKKGILMWLGLILFSMSFSSAICTVTFDKEIYNQRETITTLISCSEVNEKGDDYTFNWTNSTGYVIESDSGTTPAVADTNFFESYIIDKDFVNLYGTNITATLSGGDTEGFDFANITSASSNSLILTDVELSTQFLVGRSGGIHFTVIDENSEKINNAKCFIEILDANSRPVIVSETPVTTLDGEAGFSTKEITPTFFQEGESYAFKVHCACGGNETALGCWDSDGLKISESAGTGTFSFSIGTWMIVNTVVNNANYVGSEEMFICANLTNLQFNRRVPVEIFHQVRCSAGVDNNEDRDRALIFSDSGNPDERGIDVGTTQMQCKRFVVPEPHYLQGLSSECYASTSVWVLNERREKIMNYVTASPKFNITISDIKIDPDWQRISEHIFNTIIDLSDKKYSIFNAQGIGNIDVRLDKQYTESIRAKDQYVIYPQRIQSFIFADSVNNIVVYNSTGGLVEAVLEVLHDGNIEIEVRNVDISSSGWINITMEIENFDERQSIALEGIENRTGTFHFSVECVEEGRAAGQTLTCQISAKVEASQVVEKETDFTCYILDTPTGDKYSEINFNQMVTRELFTTTRGFLVPSITHGEKRLFCEASYYNLGSRTDTFYDTFEIVPTGGGGFKEEEVSITEKIKEAVKDLVEKIKSKQTMSIAIFAAIFFFALVMMLFLAKRKRSRG